MSSSSDLYSDDEEDLLSSTADENREAMIHTAHPITHLTTPWNLTNPTIATTTVTVNPMIATMNSEESPTDHPLSQFQNHEIQMRHPTVSTRSTFPPLCTHTASSKPPPSTPSSHPPTYSPNQSVSSIPSCKHSSIMKTTPNSSLPPMPSDPSDPSVRAPTCPPQASMTSTLK